MGQQQKLDLKIKGLYTSPNNFASVPAGALEAADNIVIDRDSIANSRRGQTQYGEVLDIDSGQINKLFNFKTTLLSSYNDKMAYDSGSGVWVPYSGTYLPPMNGTKIRSLEASGNFYFTTSEGVKKIDDVSSEPRESGAPQGLGGTTSLSGVTGFLLDDSAVAYRVLWGYRDANNNLILGAPSQRMVQGNDSGSPADVSLTLQIPDSITTEYFYQIYRSDASATFLDEPSDELQLVIEGNPTSGEIAARQFTVLDQTPYSLMGATLYTSPSQEGILAANNQPPFAVDMDVFKNCAFYANIRQKQSLTLTVISVEFPSLGYLSTTGDWNGTTAVITNIPSTTDLRVGMKATGTGIPATARILSIDSSTQVTLTVNTTAPATGGSVTFKDRLTLGGVDYFAAPAENAAIGEFLAEDSFTPEENIYLTALSIVEVVNIYASNTSIYAYYISGTEDLPGKIYFQERSIGGAAFSATSTAGSSFNPTLPPSGTSVLSENQAAQNRVAISKPNQVEAVPLTSYLNIGSANFPILRVVALRDGIFFFKPDGIYRISGEVGAFNVSLVDNTVVLKAPESAVAFNNQVFCFTTQGVCAVTDGGAQIMSVPIENRLLELSSEQFTNFSTATFGVAYESSRQYMLFTVGEETDTFATQAFIYNSLTNTWTRWIMNRTCGIVNPGVNKLFMGQADTGQVLIERKNYTPSDYADEEYPITIVSIDTENEITVDDASNVAPGMTLTQGFIRAIVLEVSGDVLTMADASKLSTGAAIVYTPIENFVQWASVDVDNPGLLKHFSEITYFFRNAAFREIDASFGSSNSPSPTVTVIMNLSGGQWGAFPWGAEPWGGVAGGQIPLRTYIPRDKARCSWLTIGLRTNEAFTSFSLSGVSAIYTIMSSRFK